MIHRDSGIGSVSPASILVIHNLKELTHMLIPIDVSKEIQEEETWWVIARGVIGRVAVSHKRSDKGEIDQRCDHFRVSTLHRAIVEDFNSPR